MPNKKVHQVFALSSSFLVSLVLFTDYLSIIVFCVLSVVSSILPDILERPKSRKHRKGFHSYTALILSIIFFFALMTHLISGLVYGYFSHLLLDLIKSRKLPKF